MQLPGILGSNLSLAGHRIPIIYLLIAGVAGFFFVKSKGGATGPVDSAPDVVFNLNPPQITPNVPTNLTGQFQTMQGMPVTVKQGYYYVFLVMPTGMKHLVSQGSLGMNIAQFNVPINTSGLQPAGMNKYSLVVTDVPLTQQELGM